MSRRQFNRRTAQAGLAALAGSAVAGSLAGRALPAAAQTATQPAAEPAWAAALRLRARHEGRGFAAALIMPGGDELAFAGTRSATQASAPDAGDRFEYGSVTKTFTALLLADAVQRRDLQLAEPVEAALGRPLRDSAGEPITWLDLATHRSGLPRLPANLEPPRPADPYAGYGAAQLQAFVEAWKPQVPRQARWEYSNLGFGLLGHALGLRAGKPYPALLAERVLQPLGLTDIRVATPGDPGAGLLPGHDDQRRAVPRWTFDALAGAGALIGPLPALVRYARCALGLVDNPLAPAFALTLQRHADAGQPANAMGLGWILGTLNGRRIANHDGGTYGFSSSLFLDPGGRRASVVLANAFVSVTDLALHLLDPAVPPRDVVAEQAQTQRPAAEVAASALAVLAGVYALNPQFKLSVRTREARLFAQATGQGEFELFAQDTRRFFARITALEILFEGDGGTPPALVLSQGGQRLRFVRE
ncbi:MAG: beta-lactamase family protein [Rubrivivax sp.]|nr:beta-lactamase family protein [Rubrivivax sp.]